MLSIAIVCICYHKISVEFVLYTLMVALSTRGMVCYLTFESCPQVRLEDHTFPGGFASVIPKQALRSYLMHAISMHNTRAWII